MMIRRVAFLAVFRYVLLPGLFILVLLLYFYVPDLVLASGAPAPATLSLSPVMKQTPSLSSAYFIFNLSPKASAVDAVSVINTGQVAGQALLSAVDATTGQSGGAVYLDQNDPRRDVASWVQLAANSMRLNPGQRLQVRFHVTVPSNAVPGQHLGAIVVQLAHPQTDVLNKTRKRVMQVQIRSRVIIALQVNVAGPSPEQLHIGNIYASSMGQYQTLQIVAANTGNIILRPAGVLNVTDSNGHLLQHISLHLDTFLPHTQISYPAYVQNHLLPVGDYTAMLTLYYGQNKILNYETRFSIFPQSIVQVFSPTTHPALMPLLSNQNTWSAFILPAFYVADTLLLLCGTYVLVRFVLRQRQKRS